MITVTIENSNTNEKSVYNGDYTLGCIGNIDKGFNVTSGTVFAEELPDNAAMEILDSFYKEMKKAIKAQANKR